MLAWVTSRGYGPGMMAQIHCNQTYAYTVDVQITVADLFFIHQRGLMNSIYIWVANTGANLAPVAAGFITDSQGWRWVWWYFVIFFGVTLLMFSTLR